MCTTWAQAEVIVHLNTNTPKADIAAGINEAMAARVGILAKAEDMFLEGSVEDSLIYLM